MAETPFQSLSADDRRHALRVAQESGEHRAHLLEKDIWIVATLRVLFDAPFARHLTFKGGTSLSKVWRAIRRFSEDIDITYDIRAFAPDLVASAGDEALPPTRSQEKRWTRAISARLAAWVRDAARPVVDEGLSDAGFVARSRVEAERLYVGYEPMFEASGFAYPEVIVEFGARSTGEPHANQPVVCDAAACLPGLAFPEAHPTVMLAERTFWEKATAVHVFCRQERRRGERLSRHWHDLARLDEAGIAARALALSVARHKAMFFAANDACGERIDYEAAVSEHLQLVPSGAAHAVLADDYANSTWPWPPISRVRRPMPEPWMPIPRDRSVTFTAVSVRPFSSSPRAGRWTRSPTCPNYALRSANPRSRPRPSTVRQGRWRRRASSFAGSARTASVFTTRRP